MCKQCHHGKQTRMKFKTKDHSTTTFLELVHTNLCGPTRLKGFQGEQYFMLLTDDYTRMTWVCLLNKKFEALCHFKRFKEQIEKESDLKIKCLRLDNGVEFISNEFNNYCHEQGIKRQFSATRTPQQNGVAERKNMTVLEMARTMLNEARISDIFWP